MPVKKAAKKAPQKARKAKPAPTQGGSDRDVHVQMALAMLMATVKVGLADGNLDKKELKVGFGTATYLAKNSKSKYVADAASLLAADAKYVEKLWGSDERDDERILLDLAKILKALPLEDQYRCHMGLAIFCYGVGGASGGSGILITSAFSFEEEAVTNELLANLWGMPKPLKSPPPEKFTLFAGQAEAFVELYGF